MTQRTCDRIADLCVMEQERPAQRREPWGSGRSRACGHTHPGKSQDSWIEDVLGGASTGEDPQVSRVLPNGRVRHEPERGLPSSV